MVGRNNISKIAGNLVILGIMAKLHPIFDQQGYVLRTTTFLWTSFR